MFPGTLSRENSKQYGKIVPFPYHASYNTSASRLRRSFRLSRIGPSSERPRLRNFISIGVCASQTSFMPSTVGIRSHVPNRNLLFLDGSKVKLVLQQRKVLYGSTVHTVSLYCTVTVRTYNNGGRTVYTAPKTIDSLRALSFPINSSLKFGIQFIKQGGTRYLEVKVGSSSIRNESLAKVQSLLLRFGPLLLVC